MNTSGLAEFIIVSLIVGVFVFILESKSKKNKINLYDQGSFTVGRITKYSAGASPGTSRGYYYKYSIEGQKEYLKKESYKLPSHKERREIQEGDCFLVIYYKKQARLLFDYPIKDNSDFELYLKRFEEIRKNLNK